MKRMILYTLIAVFALLIPAQTLRAETPQELVTRMKKKSEALKAWEMKMDMVNKSQFMDMTATITTTSKRDADKVKSYSVIKSTTKIQGMKDPAQSETKIVSDGSTMWMESNTAGKISVMKMPYKEDPGSLEALEKMLKDGKWEVKPSEAVDGQDCAVLSHSTGEGATAMTSTYWFSEKTGLTIKIVAGNGAMGTSTTKVSSMTENPTIDDSKFSYTPPAGAEVMEMPTQGDAPGTAPKAATGPAAVAPKAPAPAAPAPKPATK